MNTFQRNETVICSTKVLSDPTDPTSLVDPATSISIVISQSGTVVITSTPLTRDGVGLYHYDYNPATNAVLDIYRVRYTALDGTRETIQDDSFLLEA